MNRVGCQRKKAQSEREWGIGKSTFQRGEQWSEGRKFARATILISTFIVGGSGTLQNTAHLRTPMNVSWKCQLLGTHLFQRLLWWDLYILYRKNDGRFTPRPPRMTHYCDGNRRAYRQTGIAKKGAVCLVHFLDRFTCAHLRLGAHVSDVNMAAWFQAEQRRFSVAVAVSWGKPQVAIPFYERNKP